MKLITKAQEEKLLTNKTDKPVVKLFDAFGQELLSATENQEEVLQIEISFNDLKLKRKQMNFLQDRDTFTIQ